MGNTHQTTSDEQHGNGNVLEVFETPITAPLAQMLQKDVGRSVEENEKTLDKFRRRSPTFACRFGPNIPCLFHRAEKVSQMCIPKHVE